jgi:PAS domain S-box-containing protein
MKKTDEELLFFLKAIIDNLPFEAWFKDANGKYRVINKYIENDLEKPTTHIIGKNDYELYPSNYADKYVDTDHALTKGDLVGYYETEYKNGIYEEYKTPIFNESSKLIGIAGFSKDVTQFRKTQNALLDSERSKAVLISNLPGAAYRSMRDENFTITFISEGCYELTGFTSEELLMKKPLYYDLILPEYRSDLLKKWKDEEMSLKAGTPDEYPIKTASGQIKWVWEQYQNVYDSNQHTYITEGLIIDITDRKQAEKALKESEERFRTIFEEAPLGMGIFDSVTGKPYQINNRFAEIVGRTIEEIMYLSWEQYTYPDDIQENQHKMSLLISNKITGFSLVKRYVKPDGKVTWASVTVTPFKYRDNYNSHLCMVEDITERKQAEELRIRKDSLEKIIEMKDEFLSNISHEFKTPLNVIFSALQTLEYIYKDEFSDKAKGLLDKIRQNSYRQLRLVNNLLDITRANAGQLKIRKTNKDIVSLTRIITDSVEIYAEQRGIKLEFSSTLKRKEIAIDEEIYERIMLNLISNAIKFSKEGKTILVNLGQKLINNKAMISIQVIDQGLGIPDEKTDLIFEKFGQVDNSFTRQAEGTGIGLSLVKMLVELLDGTISVVSKFGFGSTFSILLPIQKVKGLKNEQKVQMTNDRLISAIAVEFSDIYSSYFKT